MIKRVIIDIDNTLIPWKKKYDQKIEQVLQQLKIVYTKQELENIRQALEQYEDNYFTFDKQMMLTYINQFTNKDYPKEMLDRILEKWSHCVPECLEKDLLEVLAYLKEKYELVILTDWFEQQQRKRLEKVGIASYFQAIYSAEKTKRKPFLEAFFRAMKPYQPEECVMIGDCLERDIKGALSVGMQAIWYHPEGKEQNEQFLQIKKWQELKTII